MVVVVDEVWQSGCALVVAGEDLAVGPFGGEGAVESFDFAVLPWAVWSDEFVFDVAFSEELAESGAVAVAPGVVGDESFDAGDAVGGEELESAFDETGAGVGAFVGEDLAVGEAAVVVDDGMDVVVAGSVCAVAVTVGSAVSAPAATVGYASEFLDVHVDEFAGTFAFVTNSGLFR